MLTLQAAESAYQTTQELDRKGIAVMATPRSLLATLVASTYINYDPVVQNGEFYHDIGAMCYKTDEASTSSGYSEHTASMEEISDLIAEKVRNHLFFTRTVVAPFVDAYATRLIQAADLVTGNPDNGVEVVINNQAGPLCEPVLVDSILRSKEVVYVRPLLGMNLPEQDDNQIRALMMTGNASVDASINDYFASKETGWLASRWKTVFCREMIPAAGQASVTSAGLDAFISGRNNVDTALMVFLVSRRIWNNPLPETDMAIDVYSNEMVLFRNQAALRLCIELERIERDTQSGVLITGTENVGLSRRIIVNGVLYREFLKAGGSNEVLLGNALAQTQHARVKDLIDNKATLEAIWERHHAANRAYYDQKRLLQMRDVLVVEWEALTREYSAEDFPIPERASANAMVRRLAQRVTPRDLDDLSTLALAIACKSRFYKSAAFELLTGIARAKTNNPNISTQEAAAIATTEYVCRWIGKQLTPVSANKIQVFTSKDTQLA